MGPLKTGTIDGIFSGVLSLGRFGWAWLWVPPCAVEEKADGGGAVGKALRKDCFETL